MGRKRYVDERQMELPFKTQVETYCEAAKSILEHARTAGPHDICGVESEMELNVGVVSACKEAISRSGMSREQVLDAINVQFGRTGNGKEDAKRPMSIHVFNNYLSKPTETRIPYWLICGISDVTDDLGPLAHRITKRGGVVITAEEQTELLLGKLDQNIRAGQKLKRDILAQMRRSRAAQPNTEVMDYGKAEGQRTKSVGSGETGNGRAKRGGIHG